MCVCMLTSMHVSVYTQGEAEGQHGVSSSVTLHLLETGLSLDLEIANTAGQTSQPQGPPASVSAALWVQCVALYPVL